MVTPALKTALETQLQLLEEFLDLLSRETGELTDIHLDAMAEINTRKENMAARIKSHAAVLRKEMQAVAISEGLSDKTTLGGLADMYKQKGMKEVSHLHVELNRVAERIRQTISINSEIADRFAASVTGSLNVLSRMINQTSTYGASGSYQQRQAGSVMINREA